MDTFTLLETRRKHVMKYSEKIPSLEVINNALWKAWKTSPSKNNFNPYEVFVLGPDKQKDKDAVYSMVRKDHIRAEDDAVEKGYQAITQNGAVNPFYEHIKLNPYLVVITSRVCKKANKFYERKIAEGHHPEQMIEEKADMLVSVFAVEVGLFMQNLTNYLLEENIDISYNSCFIRDPKVWQKAGLEWCTHMPIAMMSIGYASRYRKQELKPLSVIEDIKPEIDEIITWIQ
jgi:hypothetical protein